MTKVDTGPAEGHCYWSLGLYHSAEGHKSGVYLTSCLSMISVSPNIKGDAEPVSRAKWEWCELGQCSGLPGGGDTEADVTASLNRSRERESRDRQFGAALGLEVGLTWGRLISS